MNTTTPERKTNLNLLRKAWQVHFLIRHVHLSKAERKGKTPEQLFAMRLERAQKESPQLFSQEASK